MLHSVSLIDKSDRAFGSQPRWLVTDLTAPIIHVIKSFFQSERMIPKQKGHGIITLPEEESQ